MGGDAPRGRNFRFVALPVAERQGIRLKPFVLRYRERGCRIKSATQEYDCLSLLVHYARFIGTGFVGIGTAEMVAITLYYCSTFRAKRRNRAGYSVSLGELPAGRGGITGKFPRGK
jgi:hypothetical protein